MKALFAIIGLVAPLAAFPALNYSQVNLTEMTSELCHHVDRLQQGSYHYFDCLDFANEIQDKNKDLIKDTFKICSKSYVNEEDKCYSSLSKNFFSKKIQFPVWNYDLETEVLTLVSQAVVSKTIDELRYDEENTALYDALFTTFQLVDGWALNPMDTSVLFCSNISLYEKLVETPNPNAKEKCYQTAFEFLEKKAEFK
jgi:hypothetical protein